MRPSVNTLGRKRRGMGSHQATVGKTVEWYTPPGIFDALRLEFDREKGTP